MSKRIFSGIQPSGDLHIGNYAGAIKEWVKMQNDYESIFCIVDLHAITVRQDPKTLREKILQVSALYLACGIEPNKSHIFVQSQNPDHTALSWILNCFISVGQLERMTQFKDKIQKQKEVPTAGLFDYPALMAADILLYQTDEVPVGEDQKQHIELTRDVAERFNKLYGQVFKLPSPHIMKETARIMSLQNPDMKMSKSDKNPLSRVNLLDSEDQIREKIKKAVTDSETSIKKEVHSKGEGAVQNLLAIYSAFSEKTIEESIALLDGKPYSEFKTLLADLLVEKLGEIQKRYKNIRDNEDKLREILDQGRDFAVSQSSSTLQKVKEAVGLF